VRPGGGVRVVLVATAAAVALALLAARALRFARALPTRERVARRIERARPEVEEGAVVSALSLWAKRGDERCGYSPALIDAHVAETAERAAGRARGALEARALRPALIGILALSGALAAGRALAPDATGAALARLGDVGAHRPPAVTVEPGDVRVVAGADVAVRAEVEPRPGRAPSVEVREGGDFARAAAAESSRPTRVEPLREALGTRGIYEAVFKGVRDDFTYQVRGEGWTSPVYRVTVDRPPLLLTIEKRYRYPAYSGLAEQVIEEGDGHLKALRGTQVALTVKSGGPMARGALELASGATVPLAVGADAVGTRGAHAASATLTIREPDRYRIVLGDASRGAAETSPAFDIQPVADDPPIVTLLSPASDTTLSRQMALDVRIGVLDDFGVSKIALVYSKGEGEHRIPVYDRGERRTEIDRTFAWDLSQIEMMPGEVLTFYAEAWDNDAISGPKRGVSRAVTARFPTLAEVFEEVRREEAGQAESLEEAFDESMGLKERVEAMTRELKRERDEEVSWQKKEEIEKILKKQEALGEQLQKVAEKLDETMTKLEENDLADAQVLEKLAEVRRLMEEVATDEMRAAMERLRKAMEQLDPKEIAEASKDLKLSQEEFLKRLDRTIEMLKDVQRERRVDEMVKSMEALLERQEALLDATKSANEAQMKELATEQEAAQRDLEDAVAKMDELAKELAEREAAASEAIEKTAEELRREKTDETMADAAQSLARGAQSSASAAEKKSAADLASAVQGLQNAQSQMNAQRDEAIRQAIEKGIRDLIYISKAEEGIVTRTEEATPPDGGGRAALARRQVELKQGIDKVAAAIEEAAKRTPHIGPTVPEILREASESASDAARSFSEGQARAGGLLGDRTMVTVNAGLLKLLEAQKDFESSCQNGKQGGQCQNPGLNSAAQGQKRINSGARTLAEELGMGGQRLTQSQRQRLAQLAAEQEAVRKGLEEFGQSLGERENVLGRLDKIEEDMKEAMRDLSSERPEDAAQRGERILQRLLDADKSFQRRGFKKERTSETAKTGENAATAPPVSEILEKATPKEREDILRTMSVRFPEEYEALIHAYFEALEKDRAGGR
jgi:hypothetical protein